MESTQSCVTWLILSLAVLFGVALLCWLHTYKRKYTIAENFYTESSNHLGVSQTEINTLKEREHAWLQTILGHAYNYPSTLREWNKVWFDVMDTENLIHVVNSSPDIVQHLYNFIGESPDLNRYRQQFYTIDENLLQYNPENYTGTPYRAFTNLLSDWLAMRALGANQ